MQSVDLLSLRCALSPVHLSRTLALGLLLAVPSLAQRSAPEPPPFDATELATWNEVGEARLAQGLSLAATGDLAAAVEALNEVVETGDTTAKARATQELERVQGLVDFREGWLKGLAKDQKNLRLPVEGKMTAFKVASIEGGEILFTKARKGVDRLALNQLDAGLLMDNLGKGLKKLEPAWLQAYLPTLAQREFDASKIKGLDEDAIKGFDDYAWLLPLGALTAEIDALSKAGYPETRPEQMALIERLGAVQKAQTTIPALRGITKDLKSYAHDLASLAFANATLGELVYGKATDLGNGRWNIVYEFDNADEAKDFYTQDGLFEYCLPEPTKPLDMSKSGWLHNESSLAWAGRVSLVHYVPFEGAMSAKYDFKVSKIGKTFDIQGGNLIFGMAAKEAKLSFIGQAFIHSVWCYKSGQLLSNSIGIKPMYQNRTYKCSIGRDEAGLVSGSVDGHETGKLELPEVDSGPFFLAANLNIRGRLERLELEGKADELGIEYFRKLRAFHHLETFGLDGAIPEKPIEE